MSASEPAGPTRVSADAGHRWRAVAQVTTSGRNHTYVRKPYGASPSFWALSADGDALQASPSALYFAGQHGEVLRLPGEFDGEWAVPEPVAHAISA